MRYQPLYHIVVNFSRNNNKMNAWLRCLFLSYRDNVILILKLFLVNMIEKEKKKFCDTNHLLYRSDSLFTIKMQTHTRSSIWLTEAIYAPIGCICTCKTRIIQKILKYKIYTVIKCITKTILYQYKFSFEEFCFVFSSRFEFYSLSNYFVK